MALPGATHFSKKSNIADLTSPFSYDGSDRDTSFLPALRKLLSISLPSIILTYFGLFYGPSILQKNVQDGLSQSNKSQPVEKLKNRTPLEKYLHSLTFQRGYLRKGERIRVLYRHGPNVKLFLHVEYCDAPVIIDAVYCGSSTKSDIDATMVKLSETISSMMITIDQTGFYHFSESAQVHGGMGFANYAVSWHRQD